MVVTSLPTAAETFVVQEKDFLPSICTVQAPHLEMPQPYLVPVSPMLSRSTHRSGVSGSTSTVWDVPFTMSVKDIR